MSWDYYNGLPPAEERLEPGPWPLLEDELRRIQDNRCGICGQPGDRFVLDHDHTTGFVRGLLCRSCNNHEGQHRCERLDEEECAVCLWRLRPAVCWVGWTVRYEFDDFERSASERWLELKWAPTSNVASMFRDLHAEQAKVFTRMWVDR